MTMDPSINMSFDEALQHVVTVAVTQLKPQDQRLRHALREVINFQEGGSSKPSITNAHLDALQWLVDRRDSR
jgi:hypothetical protein